MEGYTQVIMREWNLASKVYVGNLGENPNKEELETIFSRYGQIKNIYIGNSKPGFAFIEFTEERDAERCARALDNAKPVEIRTSVCYYMLTNVCSLNDVFEIFFLEAHIRVQSRKLAQRYQRKTTT